MTVRILGLGTWLPEKTRTNDAWPDSFRAGRPVTGDRTFNDIPAAEDEVAAAILARHLAAEASDPFLGSTKRHVADQRCTVVDAAVEASRAALHDARIEPSEVDLILSNDAAPDRIVPPSGVSIAHRLGAASARAYGMDVACASALAQIEMALSLVQSGFARTVLCTQTHLFLRTIELSHPASPGLGDCATAFVVGKGEGFDVRSVYGITHGEFDRSVTWMRSGDGESDSLYEAGGPFRLGTRDPRGVKILMRDTVTFGAATIREAASQAGVDIERIELLASVQPRGFFPGAIVERLGLPPSRAFTTYDRVAHVGTCGPIFNLAEARRAGRIRPGAIVAVYGQGAGFTRMAAILEAGGGG